ncbi:VanZ family protein [Evansella clarkii]|uniref:VanZ family protein n=1 Tax=Evansella clarkii TaxID=79879 RepID=UPI001431D3C1|nr:VanZ family protein [Evansella clarkii]
MDKFKLLFFNLLPFLVVASVIFIASSQSSDEQDISPILDRVSDETSLRESIDLGRGILESLVARGILFTESNPLLAAGLIVIFLVIITAIFYKFTDSGKPAKKRIRSSIAFTVFLGFSGLLLLALLKSEAVILILRNYISFDHLRAVLQYIDFTYAGTRVNVDYWGVEGLLQFFIRKSAHFILFALLAFFLFLTLFRLSRRKFISFFLTMIFVVAYAALDEYRQSFIPTRSALVEDVILDSAGGLFGATIAFLKVSIFNRGGRGKKPKGRSNRGAGNPNTRVGRRKKR